MNPPERTTRRQRADARRNRELVLDAARAAFAEHGPDASLEEIARSAGVGIGTLYRHFPTRQSLQEAVFRDNADALYALGEELRDAPDPYEALRQWLHAQVEQHAKYRALGAAVMISALDNTSDEPRPCDALRGIGAELLERAQQAGAVRPDVDVDDVCRLGSAIALATEDAPGAQVCVERLFTLMMDGLRPHDALLAAAGRSAGG